MRIAYFTICSANYAAYARTLHASLACADPEAARDFHLFLADEITEALDAPGLGFPVIEARLLGIPTFWDMAFRYTIMEFNTAIKPDCFRYLFNELGYDAAVFLDPDIFVLRKLDHVHSALRAGANLVLTPHATAPLEDGFDPDDLRILRTGAYNLGFCAFRRSETSAEFLSWWARRLAADCRVDLENGIFVDQKFMDLAPSLVGGTRILRHPGYNVAYWNLSHRPVERREGGWTAGGQPLYFAHFSGIVPGDPSVFSKHQNRFDRSNIGDLADLLDHYLDTLAAMGHPAYAVLPYAYGVFTDGSPIPDMIRRAYIATQPPGARERHHVFARNISWAKQPSPRIAALDPPRISVLMHEVWAARPDLQRHFNLQDPKGRDAFIRWFQSTAGTEHGLSEDMLAAPARDALPAPRADWSGVGEAGTPGRLIARQVLRSAPALRPVYRRLPEGVRSRVRDAVIEKSATPAPKARRAESTLGSRDGRLAEGLGVYGYFRTVSGVGQAARRTILALKAADIRHSCHVVSPQVGGEDLRWRVRELIEAPSPYRALLFHINADQTALVLSERSRKELRGRYRIGYWAWELSGFPKDWHSAIDLLDEIWVPSHFVKEAVARHTDRPVQVVPHPVPVRPTPANARAHLGLPEDRFLVLCAMDLNSYERRKNPEGAIEAFLKAFPGGGRDAPLLVVKLHGEGRSVAERAALVARLSTNPRLILIDERLAPESYFALQAACDAYLSLHRSEGFGLNVAECMAAGKPVIATDYGGVTDFLSPGRGYPVRWHESAVPEGAYPHGEGQVWAEPDIEDAAHWLVHVREHPDDAETVGAAARAHIAEHYSAERVGALILEHLNRIWAEFP